ncbi:hypothetical protein BD780_000468 [Clostridium tetanomorphum]|uniref:Iron-only hydrogenase system regulator n=1 Tax=Clostridium tetanomorphum TaxID=1553 RepID=A0A923ED79_CLOTT|nr:hypothetical protein [Clostridium tetanomorphum]KAJ50524.1 hypothetical protein CTM_17441 [Clostridium tetanomorphum DSM 665]MBC2399876.1 hypothetical protein [Clostridium tetanomorphum]MBP1866349.1 hypothetical protein [Clostridium tetanomorphum]NRS83243.1 hypothetical protein [Clostridium tetanomorphum]NRZ98657.1 hypothetical protein [Clostridium tetanomorphum]
MEKTIIMGISINTRNTHAVHVQDVLTKHGCIIKTRLGLHETSDDCCSRKGIVLLQLCGSDQEISELEKDLLKIEDVTVNTMEI